MNSLYESLSPLERKIIPLLGKPFQEILEKSGLDETSALRAAKFLENKKLVTIEIKTKKIVDVGVNGAQYKKTHLPERTLLLTLEKKKAISLNEISSTVKLSENEVRSAIGTLRKKDLITIQQEKIILSGKKEDLIRKFPEEELLEKLPIEKEKLTQEQIYALESLEKRKEIIEFIEKKEIIIKPLPKIKEILSEKRDFSELIEQVTPELIKEGVKNKKFRRYDLIAPVPKIHGGRKNIVQLEIERAKKIWMELGFTEMTGRMTESSFWVFDSLFTAQDHPVREMQDSFYIKQMHASLPKKELVQKVKEAHEKGIDGSTGWQYSWQESEAQRVVLRTHTTSLSAKKLANLKKENLPAKFFAVGKAFRNETIDWSHGIEFFQTEGIVIDKKVTFRDLLGYLEAFYKKMGFEKVRFRPSFFPYTEPSVEVDVYHHKKKQWFELGGAGMLRPEVTIPLLGEKIPVLAWGQGLDRMVMEIYKVQDLRELYANDLKKTRLTPIIPKT